MALTMDEYSNVANLEADDIRVIKYLKGETIDVDGENGYVLVCVAGYPLGWGKRTNGSIKNKYLAGWRLMS